MEQDIKKSSGLGLAVYIPLILTLFFMFLTFSVTRSTQIYLFGFIPNLFYISDPTSLTWNFGGAMFSVVFGLLSVCCLIITLAMLISRTAKAVLKQEDKPASQKTKIITVIFILLIIVIVWSIYKFGIH